jgi:hypothetical protein
MDFDVLICTALVWMAPRAVSAGKEWAESIVDAIESAKALILVF